MVFTIFDSPVSLIEIVPAIHDDILCYNTWQDKQTNEWGKKEWGRNQKKKLNAFTDTVGWRKRENIIIMTEQICTEPLMVHSALLTKRLW